MWLKNITYLFKKTKKHQYKEPKNTELLENYVHRYPAFPKGIVATPLEDIIESQKELIQQITLAKGLAGSHNEDKVQQQIMEPINYFAQMVHLLPASEKEYFRTPGGLFRFGLENALHSIRNAERSMLTQSTPEVRKETERLWTHACFLAGLVNESIRTLSTVSVYSNTGHSWHPGVEPLYQWLQTNKVESYHLRWSKEEDRSMAVTVAGKTISGEQAKLLSQGEKAILATLMSALYNLENLSNPIAKIVQSVRYRIIEKDLASDSSKYGKPAAGMHLSPWLIDSMRHLLKTKRWVVNDGIGRVWYGQDGVYLMWPLSASDLRHELKDSKCPFSPNTDEILAEIMLDSNIISSNGYVSGYIFIIGIPQTNTLELKQIEAVRLTNKEILFGSDEYEPDIRSLEIIEENKPESDKDKTTSISEYENIENEKSIQKSNPVQPAIKAIKEQEKTKQALKELLNPTEINVDNIKNTNTNDANKNNEITHYGSEYSSQYNDEIEIDYNDFNYFASDTNTDKEFGSIKSPNKDISFEQNNLLLSYDSNSPKSKEILKEKVNLEDPTHILKSKNGYKNNNELLSLLISSPSSESLKKKSKTKKKNKNEDDFLEITPKKKTINQESKTQPKIILDYIKKNVSKKFLSRTSEGFTKVQTNELNNVDLNEWLSILNETGLLVLIDGNVIGVDDVNGKKHRYFVVKVDITSG